MAENHSPNDATADRIASLPSLYGGVLLALASLLGWWLTWVHGKFLVSSTYHSPETAASDTVLTFTRRDERMIDNKRASSSSSSSTRQDKPSLPSASAQAQPTASEAKAKHVWVRIAGVPTGWNSDDVRNALRIIDAETRLHNVSMFPACFGDSQVALCELDSGTGFVRRISSSGVNYFPISFRGKAVSLDIDSHFYDLTPLNTPEAPVIADIVAVTGLAGHAFGSWRSRKTGQMWLKDFLPEDIKRIRVMTYGYNSNLVEDTVEDGFLEYRRRFIHSILDVRQGFESRPIIFIGHSMGGILILQALLQCKYGGQYRPLFDATRGIFFFGTPHLGMEVGQILSIIDNGSTDVSRRAEFVRQLREGSYFLDTQREDINSLWDANSDIEVFSFYETRKTPSVKKSDSGSWARTGSAIEMVPKRSAQLFWTFEHRVSVPADHTDIVKLPSHEDPTYRTLVRFLKNRIESVGKQKAAATLNKDIPFMIPYSQNKSFIGQEKSRIALDQALGPDDAGHRRLAVWGLGGVGKTQTVLDYVYQFQHRKPVFWIHAGTRVKFEQDYRKVAQLALLPGYDDAKVDIRPLVCDWLEGAESGDWILVLDNADNLNDFFEESTTDNNADNNTDDALARFIPYGSKGTVLVTTRDEVVALRLCDNEVLTKEVMDRNDAIRLFRCLCPRIRESDSDARLLDALLEELSYLPLAVAQAASYLRENRLVTLSKYLEQFQSTKEERLRLLSRPFTNLRRNRNSSYLETALTTFTISFQQIEEQSPLAGSLLRVMVCINRQGMPVKLFKSVKRSDSDKKLDSHKKSGLDDHTETVEEALSRMISFSLLTSSQESAVEMHAFIHLSAQQYLSERRELREAVKATAELMAHVLPEGDIYEERALWREYLPHASALITTLEELEQHPGDPLVKPHTSNGPQDAFIDNLLVQAQNTIMVSNDFNLIYYLLGSYYLYAGQYTSAERVNFRTCQISTTLYGKEHPKTLNSMVNLAATYSYQGRLKEAEELEVWAMETSLRVLGEEHPHTLVSMVNLATTYWNQGRWKEAEELELRTMESRKKVLGEEHPDTLTSMANLATTYRRQGRWKEAEELHVQALEMKKRVLGEEHPDTLASMINLASTYHRQGRWKEAEDLEALVVETSSRVLGEEHPITLNSMVSLAATYKNQGRWEDAEELEVRAMETSSRVLGDEHPDTLTSMLNLAVIYGDQERWGEAEKLQVRVMETRKKIFGDEHPDTLTSMVNLATTYRDQGRWKEAEELHLKAMETGKKILGEDHPDTLTSMVNLASTYWYQGRWKEAEVLDVRVMETRKKVLGEEHPDTLTSISNLALTYQDQGRWKEAEELQERAMETRKKVLGEENPITLASMANLAHILAEQQRLSEAIPLMERTVELHLSVLGEHHPRTASLTNMLQIWKSQYCP